MTGMLIVVATAAATFLFGVTMSLIAFQRLRRVSLATRGMLADLPLELCGKPAPKGEMAKDLHRLKTAFDAMVLRIETQEATLDQACELAGLGTWTILPNLTAVRASSHIRTIFGFPDDEEIVNIDLFREQILPEERHGFDAALTRAVNERRMTDAEFRATDASGAVRILRARTGPNGANPDESQGGISGIIQDITDLRHKEAALTRSLELERLAGEAARVGGWHYDMAPRMFTGTPETAKLVGLDDHWYCAIEDAMDRLLIGENRSRMERSFWTCVGSGIRFDEIAEFKKFDGDVIWLRVIGEAEYDESGKIVGAYGATQDVGELISAQRATQEVQALLQTILDESVRSSVYE